MNKKTIIDKQFRDSTGRSSSGFDFLDFTLDEVQTFLNHLGYDIILHEGIRRNQDIYGFDGMDSINLGKKDVVLTVPIAIKDNVELPKEFTDDVLIKFELMSVFSRELKNKILFK